VFCSGETVAVKRVQLRPGCSGLQWTSPAYGWLIWTFRNFQ